MDTFSNKKDDERKKMVGFMDKVIQDISLTRKIEKSIYNYVIKLSKERNIQRRWSNTVFKNCIIQRYYLFIQILKVMLY